MYSNRTNTPHKVARVFGPTRQPAIAVIGCGGTGSLLAEMLCRLLTGTPATLLLVDPDRVEEHNLLRQNFLPNEVGQPKSRVLAQRLSNNFRRSVGYSENDCRDLFETALFAHRYNLVIGCVDNALARASMNSLAQDTTWLMDCGNSKHKGQVLLGNIDGAVYTQAHLGGHAPPLFFEQRCHMLPSPATQEPDLLTATPEDPATDRDCAQAVMLQEQAPLVNQAMALTAAQLTYQLLTQSCSTMGVYIDTSAGRLRPVHATPANAARALRIPHPEYIME